LRKAKGEREVFSGEGLLSERDIFTRKDGGRDIFRKGKEESFQAEGKGGKGREGHRCSIQRKILKAKKNFYLKSFMSKR
jgi:hypothetical protein